MANPTCLTHERELHKCSSGAVQIGILRLLEAKPLSLLLTDVADAKARFHATTGGFVAIGPAKLYSSAFFMKNAHALG